MSTQDEDGLEAHAARIAELVSALEALPDSEAKATALELIEDIDHLHRTCVWRLFAGLSELGGKGLVDRLVSDPVVKMLFVLYDLVPSVPLTPVESTAPVEAPLSSGFVPLHAVEGLKVEPLWRVAFEKKDLPAGTLQAVEIDRVPVLLVSTDDGIFAYRNACPGSILPLHLGTISRGELQCPWHGCRYRADTGERVATGTGSGTGSDSGGGLERFAVSVDDDVVRVAKTAKAKAGAEP